jgi:tetratricopeptide (TPR) repeat protein
MKRFRKGLLLFAFTGMFAYTGAMAVGQSNAAAAQTQSAGLQQSPEGEQYSAELLRQIALEEAEARSSEKAHADRSHLTEIYAYLGNLYANAAMYPKAEDAMRRAIALMKNGPQDQLALELGQLGVLHVQMGDISQADRDEMQALRSREAVGDPIGIALAWNDIAGLYDEEHKFKKAVDFGQKAFAVLANRTDLDPSDRIGVRQTLGYALTSIRNCDQGIPMLKDAVELSISNFGKENPKLGYPEYVLGFGYWHCGDWGRAAEWLDRGTTRMKADFGWDRSLYLNAMRQYSRFLRESGQPEAAVNAETVVNQANALVDARTLIGTTEGFRSPGSR